MSNSNRPIKLDGLIFDLNGSEPIASGAVQIDGNESGDGITRFVLSYESHIFIFCKLKSSSIPLIASSLGFLNITVGDLSFPRAQKANFALSMSHDGTFADTVLVSNSSRTIISDVLGIRFGIVNAPKWISESIAYDGENQNRLSFSIGDFSVQLDTYGEGDEKIRKSKGYSFTAVGQLARTDGNLFNNQSVEVNHIFEVLGWGLTFATGHWPLIPVAISTDVHNKESAKYKITRHSPYNWGQTWFSQIAPSALLEVFDGLNLALKDPVWENSIKEAINWYSDALSSQANVVGKLIWAQTALELMAWTYVTQDPKTKSMSGDEFDGDVLKSTSQRIAKMLDGMGISEAIPTKYTNLQQFAADLAAGRTTGTIKRIHRTDPLDGPSVITHVRNAYVHPNQSDKRPILSFEVQHEAKLLAIEYLELSILRVLEVKSDCLVRSEMSGSVNAVSKLPWV